MRLATHLYFLHHERLSELEDDEHAQEDHEVQTPLVSDVDTERDVDVVAARDDGLARLGSIERADLVRAETIRVGRLAWSVSRGDVVASALQLECKARTINRMQTKREESGAHLSAQTRSREGH